MDFNSSLDYTQLSKRYYTIGEVSNLFKVSNSLIRHWESEIKQLSPAKTSRGDRKFTVDDIRLIDMIHYLVRVRGFTLEGAEREISHAHKKSRAIQKQINLLEDVKKSLVRLKNRLNG